MVKAILQLLPMMMGAAIVPFCLMLVLLLLRSPDGLSKALAFAGGQILVRLVQGLGLGSELWYSAVAQTKEGAAAIVSTLLLVAGFLLWITALRSWAKQEDPDAPPPWWMAQVDSASRLKAFGAGIVVVAGAGKQWLFTFYALGVLRLSGLPGLHQVLGFLVFVVGAQALIILPIGLYALAPKQSAWLLDGGIRWLERNNQTIVMVVSA